MMHHQDKALLATILNTAVDAIIVIDSDGVIQTVNPATTRLFGYTEDEMLGENIKMLMPTPYRDEHDKYLRSYQETGRAKIIGIGREITGRRKDDTTFPIHLAVSEVVAGEKTMFAGIIRDISDLKDVQQQLIEVNQRLEERIRERTSELRETQAELFKAEKLAVLGQVSGGIAHEIRNPLNAVRTSAYYLLNAPNPSTEKTIEHLERIERQVSLIDNVITALSDVAHSPEPRVMLCSVDDVIRDATETVAMPNNVLVLNQISMNLPPVVIDPNQIAIVFRNLFRNARDAMPNGGNVQITSTVQNDEVVIKVADTGIGIENKNIGRIAEPLYTTKSRGMGMGLTISAAILKKNHGRLTVASEPGVGTTVAIYLPQRRPAAT